MRAGVFGPRDGQAIILMVVMMSLVLIGILGFAIDGGQRYAQLQMAQAAADAACGAGIMSIMNGTNATSTYTFGTGSPPIAAYTCTTSDGRTPCVYARDNGFGGTASDTVTLSYPSTVSGATLSSVTVPAFQVTVQRTIQTGLIRFIGGPATTTISAKAISGITGSVLPYSIIVLGSGANVFQANDGANVTITGGGEIAINSSNSDAATVNNATVTAKATSIVGNCVCEYGGKFSPSPTTGAAAVADPFASLPALTPASCATHPTTYYPPSNTTLTPGTYCGGITVDNGATNITFSAGQYIIDGGYFTLASGNSTGSGVMFYLTGTNSSYGGVSMSNGATATLSAPTSGTYQGILFFQNRSITSSIVSPFLGGATMNLTGTLYFPTTGLSFSDGASTSGYAAIVASSVLFTATTSLKFDTTGAKTGMNSTSASLVQ
jgi:hypothetical protein